MSCDVATVDPRVLRAIHNDVTTVDPHELRRAQSTRMCCGQSRTTSPPSTRMSCDVPTADPQELRVIHSDVTTANPHELRRDRRRPA